MFSMIYAILKLIVVGTGWLLVVILALTPVIIIWGFVCWLIWKVLEFFINRTD